MKTALSWGVRGPLLEREHELGAIREGLTAAKVGGGRVIAFAGPAGSGKTRLIDEVRSSAGRRGMTVLSARGGELESGLAFGVVRQLFVPLLRALPARDRRALLAGAAALAATVLGLDAEPVATASPDAIWHGLYWLTANVTDRGPLVLVVDDAHWADGVSLEWILYLARRAADLPLLLVLAYRESEPGAPDELLKMTEAEPLAAVVRPAPLSEAAVAKLVRHELGSEVADEFCTACHVASGGNPLLVRRLTDALAADGVGTGPEAAATVAGFGPNAVSASLFLRLGRMPPATSALAQAVAVLESESELRVAAALAGLDLDEAAVAADALAAVDVLAPGRPLMFVHPVVRAAVYADIGEAQRSRAHARAARLLDADGAPPGRVAGHLLRTEPYGDPWNVALLRAAARGDMARGASGAAVSLLRRALREPPSEDERPDVLLELGMAEAQSADPAGPEHLAEALEHIDDPRRRAQAVQASARSLMAQARISDAIAGLQRGIDELDGRERELDLFLKAELLASARIARETRSAGLELLAELEVPAKATTPGERALLAQVSSDLCAMPVPAAETAEVAERALADGHLVSHDGPETFAACYALGIVDRLYEAHRAASDAIDAAVRQGGAWRYVYLLAVRGEMAYRMGRLADAEADAGQGFDTLGGEPAPLPRALLTKVQLAVLLERGRLDEAQGELDRLGTLERPVMAHVDNELRFMHGKLLVARGEAKAASEVFLACGELEDAWQVASPAMLPWRSACAEALLLSGEREHAQRLAREELELARAVGAPRAIGIALRAVALAAERNESIGLLREAVATLEDSPARLEHARALADLGATLRRADRRADARAVLKPAFDIAYDCGAVALAERARTELLAAGSRPRRLAADGRDALTPSERRVASMAAEGRTNKELAQALFVTVKTVEMHLANAYRKLGISSRAELAGALQARESPD